MVVAGILALLYRIAPTVVSEGPEGTATRNYVAEDRAGRRWFVKAYPGEAARADGVPVPAVRRTVSGEVIASAGGLSVSVTEYVAGAETAEGGLSGGRWDAVGEAVGRLHRILARHPAGPPRPVAAREVCDVTRAGRRLEELLDRWAAAPPETEGFAAWAHGTAARRLAALPEVAARLEKLPDTLTEQIVHGDLASPNLLLRGEAVAAVIDFRPPGHRSAAWEPGRIVLDPRTVLGRPDEWDPGPGPRRWRLPVCEPGACSRGPPRRAARRRRLPGLLGLSPVRAAGQPRLAHSGSGGIRARSARGRGRAVAAPGGSRGCAP
jgi:homoserine kinase type II